ncbi:CopK family periplasmic copper-binding protein [Aromatoleum evansii]|nr:CopK family periplasmic copper-binding protein [Aromatoleum evansii]
MDQSVHVFLSHGDGGNVEKSHELKDGPTVYIFQDGKMAMEDKFGRATSMEEGDDMETKDGVAGCPGGRDHLEPLRHQPHQALRRLHHRRRTGAGSR